MWWSLISKTVPALSLLFPSITLATVLYWHTVLSYTIYIYRFITSLSFSCLNKYRQKRKTKRRRLNFLGLWHFGQNWIYTKKRTQSFGDRHVGSYLHSPGTLQDPCSALQPCLQMATEREGDKLISASASVDRDILSFPKEFERSKRKEHLKMSLLSPAAK